MIHSSVTPQQPDLLKSPLLCKIAKVNLKGNVIEYTFSGKIKYLH